MYVVKFCICFPVKYMCKLKCILYLCIFYVCKIYFLTILTFKVILG